MTNHQPKPLSPRMSVDADGLAHLTFDAPDRSANVLTEEVMGRLSELLGELHSSTRDGTVQGVLVTSAKSSFIVGADIDAFAAIDSPDQGARASRLGQDVFLQMERLSVPTLVAIHGACMGGGTELALACRHRVASDAPDTRIGLPEVQLGILPAWGGTTRLPRLIGLQASLDLLLTGKPVDGAKAARIGLVEEVLPKEGFAEAALELLRTRVQDGSTRSARRRGLGNRLLEDTAPGRRVLLAAARRKVETRTGGHYPAPIRILDVVRRSMGRPLKQAFELESDAAGELLASRVSKNLVHVFHLRERARKKLAGEDAEAAPVDHLGVVGAGVMGGGIAQLAAYHGIRVRIKDVHHEAVSQALQHANGLFESAVEKRKLSRREAEQGMERISGGIDYSGFGQCRLVVEAVVENLEVKRTVLGELEDRVPEGCVLTTNTSSLSVDRMAEALRRPEQFAGMHFFNPVHRMPLVEVVRGAATDARTVATVYGLALGMGKVPVVVMDGPGFLVNRILGPYLNEAGYLVGEGAPVEAVDAAARDFGLPMGPLRLIDEVGIDVMRHAGETLHQAFGDRMAPAPSLIALGESGRLGRKGGAGLYRYEDGREAGVDPEVYPLLNRSAPSGAGAEPEEIRVRLLLMMINEAARALDDGIVASAADVDLAMIMGAGFPPFRGGLLRFADEIHPRSLFGRLERYERAYGSRFTPAPILRQLAADDRSFYEAYPAGG